MLVEDGEEADDGVNRRSSNSSQKNNNGEDDPLNPQNHLSLTVAASARSRRAMQSITNVGKNGGYGRRMVKNGSRALMKMRSKDQINMMAAAAAKAQE